MALNNDSALLARVVQSECLQAFEVLDLLLEFEQHSDKSLDDFLKEKGLLSSGSKGTKPTDEVGTKAITSAARKTKKNDTRTRPAEKHQRKQKRVSHKLANQATRYEWDSEIARGGLGSVWSAHDRTLDRTVAAKELLPDALESARMVDRFVDEAKITGQLDHPGIVPVYDLGSKSDGSPFYTMKLLNGTPWNEVIHRFHHEDVSASKKDFELHGLIDTLIDVCDAVGFAHEKNFIHRDLKPHNVIVGEFGETVVVDWGLAKSIRTPTPNVATLDLATPNASSAVSKADNRSHDRTRVGDIIGTPSYASPEQVSGRVDLDARSDVFSLGVILYEILVGKTPFRADDTSATIENVKRGEYAPPRIIDKRVPRSLNAVCEKALQKCPDHRYENAKELGEELRAWKAGQRVASYRETKLERVQRWVRFHKSLATTIAIALVGVTVACLISCALIRGANLAEQRARISAESARDDALQANQREKEAKETALRMLEQGVKTADTMLIEESGILQFYPGLEQNRKRLLEQAEASYLQYASTSSEDPLVRRAMAKSLIRVGDARQLLGRFEEAADAFQRAKEILEGIRDRGFSDSDLQLQLANSLVGKGIAEGADPARQEHAISSFQEAIETVDRLIRQHPDNDELVFARCRCQIAYARLRQEREELSEAKKLFGYAVRELEMILDEAVADRRFDLLQSGEMELGRLLLKENRFSQADRCFGRVVSRYSEKAGAVALRPDQLEGRMVCHVLLGNSQRRLGRIADAVQSYRSAIRDFDSLVKTLYRGQYHSENLAVAMVNLSQLQTVRGQSTESAATLRLALGEFIELINLHGEVPRLVRGLAETALALADAQRANGDFAAARRSYEQSAAVFDNMHSESGASPDSAQATLCRLHWAELLYRIGERQEAEELLDAALGQDGQSDSGQTVEYAQALIMLADLRWQSGELEEAGQFYLTAFQILRNDRTDKGLLTLATLQLNCLDLTLHSVDGAIATCKAAGSSPLVADFYHVEALAHFRRGEFKESRRLVDRAARERHCRNVGDLLLLGLMDAAEGDAASAAARFEESQSLFDSMSWHTLRLRDEFRQMAQEF